MNAYDRIRAMVDGKQVDRPAVSVWKHFFLEDRVVNDLVKRTCSFQDQNDWDVIKVMSNGIYLQEQYNSKIIWSRNSDEFPITVKQHINGPKGFTRLKPVDVKTGAIAREVEVAKRLVDKYKGKVPVVATVFTPLTYAQELYNGWQNPWPFYDLVRDYPDELEAGLKVLTEVTANIIEEFVKVGVDGIFYSSQFANDFVMTPELYKRFGTPYDLQAFEPAVGKTWFNILHMHGHTDIFFDLFKDYPLEAFSWEDILTNVSLKQAAEISDKILVGGIERNNDFRIDDRNQLLEHMAGRVKNAAAHVPSNRLVIAPGCAIPTDIPEYRFNVLKEAVELVFEK
ncbi:MAG: uroporphyrinogen decarboxylase family protein [Bacillus sp. (in: firmicutes)]